MKKILLLLATPLSLATAWAGEMDDLDVAVSRKDFVSAEMKWRMAGARENASSQFYLGVMHSHGKGAVQDYVEAAKWYRMAADHGLASAQYNLGWSYTHGKGVAQDYVEAVKWYTLAAKQGHTKAQYRLGVMYYDGLGVVQDYVKAHMWFNLSAVSGDANAAKNRDIAAKLLTSQQIGQAQKMARAIQSNG